MDRQIRAPGRAQARRWLVEVGPLAWVAATLWGKLVYVSVVLPGMSWAGQESVGPLGAMWAYPHVFSATLASLLLLLAPFPLMPRALRFVVLLALDLVLTSLAVADLVHVRFYADVASVSELSSTHMLAWVLESLFTLLRPLDAVYFLDIVVGIAVLPFYLRAGAGTPGLGPAEVRRLSIGLLILGVLLILPTARLASADAEDVFSSTTVRLETASAIGILPYHLSDALLRLGLDARTIGEPERERVRRFLDRERRQQGAPSELFGVAAGRNVIVISGESLQAFPIGLELAGQPITPRLSALARESLFFANHYEPTHLGSTSDAELAIMQSLYPLAVGVVAARYAGNQYRGLPAILAERGYTTFSAVAALGHFWNMNHRHRRYGFQRSFFEDSYRVTERIGPWASDREFFAQSLPILHTQQEPFAGFLLSSSSHHPYVIPEEYRSLQLGEYEGTMLGDYLHAVHYFDEMFGQFVDQLRESGLLDRSILVLYGDHQAFLTGSPELPRLLGFGAWDALQHFRVVKKVPLLIRLPHGEGAGVRTITGNHLDVAPTLLSLLGIADHGAVMLGRDLTRDRESLVVFRDGSFADGSHYFVNRFGRTGASRCYEAESGRPADCGPLEPKRRDARERLEISDLIIQGDLIPELGPPQATASPR